MQMAEVPWCYIKFLLRSSVVNKILFPTSEVDSFPPPGINSKTSNTVINNTPVVMTNIIVQELLIFTVAKGIMSAVYNIKLQDAIAMNI